MRYFILLDGTEPFILLELISYRFFIKTLKLNYHAKHKQASINQTLNT